MAANWWVTKPSMKEIAPKTMASMAPTLTPLPNKIMGKPQLKPITKQNIEMGRKILSGLKSMARFKISMTVSNAVWTPIVLFPVFLF
jgi:hypothetical protein